MSDDYQPDLRRTTILGARWMSGARIVAEAVGFASVVVLARLISPAEFGSAAVALVVGGVAIVLGPLGLTAVLVQRAASRSEIESATVLCVTLGLGLTALTALFGVSSAVSLLGERTAELITLASPAWLLAGLGGVPQALVQRELRFRRVAVFDAVPSILAAATAAGLAVSGVDGEALVIGVLVRIGSASLLAIASVSAIAPRVSLSDLRNLLGFAVPATMSSLVYVGFRHIDYVILGARMSADQVGFYWRAYQLGFEYQEKISHVMLSVSFPVYSRAQDLEELKRLRLRIVGLHATVIVPLLAGFVAVAPTLVPAVFGDVWEPAVLPAQIIAVAGMAEAVTTGVGPLLAALGRPGLLLVKNLIELAVYAVVITFLAPFGLTWVSIGVAVFGLASVPLIQLLIVRPVIGLGLRDLWSDVRPGIVIGALAVVTLGLGRQLLEDLGVPTLPLLAILAVAGVGLYAAVLRTLFPTVWADLIGILRRVAGA